MNCEEASKLVNSFIENKIDDDEVLGEYIDHICSCSKCYEELDIMYIVSAGLNGLQTDENMSFDFTGALSKKINDTRARIKKTKRQKRRFIMIDVGCMIIILLIIAVLVFENLPFILSLF